LNSGGGGKRTIQFPFKRGGREADRGERRKNKDIVYLTFEHRSGPFFKEYSLGKTQRGREKRGEVQTRLENSEGPGGGLTCYSSHGGETLGRLSIALFGGFGGGRKVIARFPEKGSSNRKGKDLPGPPLRRRRELVDRGRANGISQKD